MVRPLSSTILLLLLSLETGFTLLSAVNAEHHKNRCVQIPHGMVMLSLSIPNFYLWVWLLSKAYCMNVRIPVKDWLCRTNCTSRHDACEKQGRDGFVSVIVISTCIIILLYYLIMICICTLFKKQFFNQSWPLYIVSFRSEMQMCILSQVSHVKSQKITFILQNIKCRIHLICASTDAIRCGSHNCYI